MSKIMITSIILFMILSSFELYCYAEETPESRSLGPKETFNMIFWIIILIGLTPFINWKNIRPSEPSEPVLRSFDRRFRW